MQRFISFVALAAIVLAIAATEDGRDRKALAQSYGITLKPLGYCSTLSLTSAQKLSAICAIPAGANAIIVRAEGNAVRWRDDGVAPGATAGLGMPLGTSDAPLYLQTNLANMQFISQTGTADLNINFYQVQ